jgi:transcriptional regulator with XRE-family HTH domain
MILYDNNIVDLVGGIDMDLHEIFAHLNERRKKLGMTLASLADRAGVSLPTVVRILSGKHLSAGIDNVFAISRAMDVTLGIVRQPEPRTVRKKQAKKKADDLVGMLQGTSGLEGQGLDEQTIKEMKEQTVNDLLAGSRRRLWS